MLNAPFSCCWRKFLAHQPDFASQVSMLEEVVTLSGHLFLLLPKFHCELNPIELYWGEAKRYCRNNCDYKFSSLQTTVPEALQSVNLEKIRKFCRMCFRYMDAYERGLPQYLAVFAVKKYKSHRAILLGQLLNY